MVGLLIQAVVQELLFILAVASIATAFALARRGPKLRQKATWWIGSRNQPVSPGVRRGWVAFVILNAINGVAHPFLACLLYVRAYLLRAVFLRRGPKA